MPDNGLLSALILIIALSIIPWLVCFCHEAGHALAAIALGVPIKRIVIGNVAGNSKAVSFQMMKFPVVISGMEEGGRTFFKGRIHDWRKMLLISLAGPLTSFLVGIVAITAGRPLLTLPPTPITFLGSALILFGAISIVGGLSTCIPKGGSDGAKALASLIAGFKQQLK